MLEFSVDQRLLCNPGATIGALFHPGSTRSNSPRYERSASYLANTTKLSLSCSSVHFEQAPKAYCPPPASRPQDIGRTSDWLYPSPPAAPLPYVAAQCLTISPNSRRLSHTCTLLQTHGNYHYVIQSLTLRVCSQASQTNKTHCSCCGTRGRLQRNRSSSIATTEPVPISTFPAVRCRPRIIYTVFNVGQRT